MQPATEYNQRHMRLVERLMIAMDEWPAEITAYESHYEMFGSWTLTIRRNEKRTRVVFDGRDRYLEALRLQPDAGDFTVPPKHLGGMDFAGLTDDSFATVLEFIRSRTA